MRERNQKGAICGLLCAALLLGGATGLFAWADGRYAQRMTREIEARYHGGVLQGEDFQPLDGRTAALLLDQAAAPVVLLGSQNTRAEEVLLPYLPDYGSDLELRVVEGGWHFSYRTLDGLELLVRYSPSGQEALTVYLPSPDLEVCITGQGTDYTPHARRGVTLPGLWTALTTELKYRR